MNTIIILLIFLGNINTNIFSPQLDNAKSLPIISRETILENEKLQILNNGASMSHLLQYQNGKLFAEIFFPYFSSQDFDTNLTEWGTISPDEKTKDETNLSAHMTRDEIYQKIYDTKNTVLTFNFFSSDGQSEKFSQKSIIESIMKQGNFSEIRLKFFKNIQKIEETLDKLHWNKNPNLIFELNFSSAGFEKNADLTHYLTEIKNIILKENSGAKIRELRIIFDEKFHKIDFKNSTKIKELLDNFPAEKITVQ